MFTAGFKFKLQNVMINRISLNTSKRWGFFGCIFCLKELGFCLKELGGLGESHQMLLGGITSVK